jgi:hypothetical protein
MRAPFVPAFSFPTFADLKNNGRLAMIASGANARLLNAVSGGIAGTFNHLVGAWDAQDGTTLAGFPKVIEDYTFFVNPVVADVSGDPYPEVILGTGGYYLHAVDACGVQAPGFPKFTGQWFVGSPSVGDLDGDGALEIVATTRSGWLYAWRTMGRTTGNVQWPTFRHDNSNTGNWRTPLPFGTRRVMEAGPIVCAPRTSDAGTPDAAVDPDASVSDASFDGSPMDGAATDGGRLVASGGCACRISVTRTPSGNASVLAWGSLGLAVLTRSGRRRCART